MTQFNRRRPTARDVSLGLLSPDAEEVPPGPVSVKELRESPRRPGRYLLSLSDGRQLVVSASVLGDTGATRPGALLEPPVLDRLLDEHTVTELVDRALDYLARGRRTRRELETRLRRREAAPAQLHAALDRLEASGVLSDESVAHAEAAARLRRGEAPARVKMQLRKKGVAGKAVNEAVAEAIRDDGFDERAACLSMAERRARSLRGTDPVAAHRKLIGFLLRRGYSGSIARSVAKEVLAP
jgi:regulatory protein